MNSFFAVFGDPHFAIDIPESNFTICFDVQKNQGAVLRLLSDPYAGLYGTSRILIVLSYLLDYK